MQQTLARKDDLTELTNRGALDAEVGLMLDGPQAVGVLRELRALA
ncbi:hypothetical protein [Arthrobacter sp. TMN-50]